MHRGGPLKQEQHNQLIAWACSCAEHVLPLAGNLTDARLIKAIIVARNRAAGNATVGEARAAALGAFAVANDTPDEIIKAVARSAGHAAATAHMADHSLRAADYALKSVDISGGSADAERNWQDKQLTGEIEFLVNSARQSHKSIFKRDLHNK